MSTFWLGVVAGVGLTLMAIMFCGFVVCALAARIPDEEEYQSQ